MKLRDLVRGLQPRQMHGETSVEIEGIAYNSRQVETGFVFVAIRGQDVDGHDYIEEAIKRGARAVVLEDENQRIGGIPTVVVENSRKALGGISTVFFGNPSAAMTLIGITGTNGKTTTTYLTESILKGRVSEPASSEPSTIISKERFAGRQRLHPNPTSSKRC